MVHGREYVAAAVLMSVLAIASCNPFAPGDQGGRNCGAALRMTQVCHLRNAAITIQFCDARLSGSTLLCATDA